MVRQMTLYDGEGLGITFHHIVTTAAVYVHVHEPRRQYSCTKINHPASGRHFHFRPRTCRRYSAIFNHHHGIGDGRKRSNTCGCQECGLHELVFPLD